MAKTVIDAAGGHLVGAGTFYLLPDWVGLHVGSILIVVPASIQQDALECPKAGRNKCLASCPPYEGKSIGNFLTERPNLFNSHLPYGT